MGKPRKKGPPQISQAEYNAAIERGNRAYAAGHYATAVWVDPTTERLMLMLSNSVLVGIPLAEISYLKDATPEQRQAVSLTSTGSGVSWRTLDVDIGVPTLLTDAFGRQTLAQGLAQLGGKATSAAKAAAARANGAKGGRPKKKAA